MPAWEFLLSQRQELLDKSLAQIAISPNQRGTFDLFEEALPSARAHVMDTSGYELSGLEDIEFSSEIIQVELVAVFRPRIDTRFHQQLSTKRRCV